MVAFKRLPLSEVVDLSGRATSVLKLKEGVELNSAVICRDQGTLVLISDIGRLLRLRVTEDSLPLMGRLAQGPMTMRLLPGEQIVGAVCTEQTPLMLFSQRGLIGESTVQACATTSGAISAAWPCRLMRNLIAWWASALEQVLSVCAPARTVTDAWIRTTSTSQNPETN